MKRLQQLFGLTCIGMMGLSGHTMAQSRTLVVAAVVTPGQYDMDVYVPGVLETSPNFYDNLMEYTKRTLPDGRVEAQLDKLVPMMAESVTVTDNGTRYRFKLRQGIKSPYGNEFTADDVLWGYQKSIAQGKSGAFNSRVTGVQEIKVISRYEVEYVLKGTSRVYLNTMSNPTPTIYDSTEAKKHATPDDPYATAWLARNSAGYGPYHLESSKPGEGAVFVANKNYWREQPYFSRVVYREIPSPASRVTLIKSGQVQWAEEIPQQSLLDLKKDPKVRIESVPGFGSATLRMNPKFKPFDDVRVRKAMYYAMDYDAINRAVFDGIGQRSRSAVAPGIPSGINAYDVETDFAKARALLAEAGYPSGIDIELIYSSSYWWEEGLAVQARDSAAKAGIRITLKKIPNSEMGARRAPGVTSLPFFTHITNPSVADPGYTMFLALHTKGVTNATGYSDPVLDKLIEDMMAEPDDTKWRELSKQGQIRAFENATVIETFYPGVHSVMAPCVRGFTWRPLNRPKWYDLSCK